MSVHASEMQRVLRFLRKGEARLVPGAGGGLLLDAGDRGTIGVRKGLMERMIARKVVVRDREVLKAGPAAAEVLLAAVEGVRSITSQQGVIVNAAESPLGLLWRHKDRRGNRFLSADEFRAGERLRADYTRAQIMPRLGVNWENIGSGSNVRALNGTAGMSDTALAARERVESAIAAIGPELAGVLVDICCFLKGLETVEAERLWPARSAKIMLKSALAALARHYEPPRGAATHGILRWGAQDYRPTIRQE